MKEQKILDRLKEQNSQAVETETLVQFQKMKQFIDSGLSRSLSLDGEDKVSTLAATLLNLRDFMTSTILDNSFKAKLLSEIKLAEEEHNEDNSQQQLTFEQEEQKKS